MSLTTTTWSSVYPSLEYNAYYSSELVVSAVPAAFSFSYTLAVATGYPTLYVVEPSIFTSWLSTSEQVPRTWNYGALLPAPGNGDTETLVFTSAATYPVFFYCGEYTTTTATRTSTIRQNCSSITINAKWVNLNIVPITSAPASRSTSRATAVPGIPTGSASGSENQSQSQGLGIGAVVGIAVACFVVAGLVAAGVIIMYLRRRNRAAAASKAYFPPPPPSAANYPPPPPSSSSEFPSQPLRAQSHLYFTPSGGVDGPHFDPYASAALPVPQGSAQTNLSASTYYPQSNLGASAYTPAPQGQGEAANYQVNYQAQSPVDPAPSNAFIPNTSAEAGSGGQGVLLMRN
ncbi:hypothetical protein BJ742DRAFT_856723 [Cladochytrium replicatum]|nr:hypothetical protein BJ742DRAFT_856723 [Cladochytrium replicatum]